MFVDELIIHAKAGNGGAGVVRWKHDKFKPMAGPGGGNGGRGGDVYVRAVKDSNRLAAYTGNPDFKAESGEAGSNYSREGRDGGDLYIDIPVGSIVKDIERGRLFELLKVGEVERILKGGKGGLGNEHFKSSVNRTPQKATEGIKGEEGTFSIEVRLQVNVGLVGLPNAGKSTLLNILTRASSRVGAYPFTTTEPHLGDLDGILIADIPGLIEGAAEGKGLGHKFLRHIERTQMLLHLVSLAEEDPLSSYYTILNELSDSNKSLEDKEQWIVLTKKDLANQGKIDHIVKTLEKNQNRVFVISQDDVDSCQKLGDALKQHLR